MKCDHCNKEIKGTIAEHDDCHFDLDCYYRLSQKAMRQAEFCREWSEGKWGMKIATDGEIMLARIG